MQQIDTVTIKYVLVYRCYSLTVYDDLMMMMIMMMMMMMMVVFRLASNITILVHMIMVYIEYASVNDRQIIKFSGLA